MKGTPDSRSECADHRLKVVDVALGGGLVVVGELMDDGPLVSRGGGAVGGVLGLDAMLVALDIGGDAGVGDNGDLLTLCDHGAFLLVMSLSELLPPAGVVCPVGVARADGLVLFGWSASPSKVGGSKQAGLIDSERRGTWVYYWINPAVLQRLSAILEPRQGAGLVPA
jgi:hypothetical protein